MPRTAVTLFVSHNRLRRRVNMPVAAGPWSLDSGGFTEIGRHGKWTITPQEYVDAVYRYWDEIGGLMWASPQDWMCEPHMIDKTGLSVREHQERTVANYLKLRELGPELPFIPVLQGWKIDDYHECVDLYYDAGVVLTKQPIVGVGSVCRRESTDEIGEVMGSLWSRGLRLHGFGVKAQGLSQYSHYLSSADSMAWSARARHGRVRLDDNCPHQGDCRNCLRWALAWRRHLLESIHE